MFNSYRIDAEEWMKAISNSLSSTPGVVEIGDQIYCPMCNIAILEALKQVYIGQLLTSDLFKRLDNGLPYMKGDRLECGYCGYHPSPSQLTTHILKSQSTIAAPPAHSHITTGTVPASSMYKIFYPGARVRFIGQGHQFLIYGQEYEVRQADYSTDPILVIVDVDLGGGSKCQIWESGDLFAVVQAGAVLQSRNGYQPPAQTSIQDDYYGEGIASQLKPPLSCECGSEKCGSPAHSSWCPKFL